MIRSVHPAHLAIDFIAHFWSNCPECEAIASRRHQEHMYQLEDFIGRSPYAAHGGACARDITGMPGGEDI